MAMSEWAKDNYYQPAYLGSPNDDTPFTVAWEKPEEESPCVLSPDGEHAYQNDGDGMMCFTPSCWLRGRQTR